MAVNHIWGITHIFSVNQADGPKCSILSYCLSWRWPWGCQYKRTHFRLLERLRDEPIPVRVVERACGTHYCDSSGRALPPTIGALTFYLCNTKLHPPHLTPAKPLCFGYRWQGSWGRGAHPPLNRQSWQYDQAGATIKGDGTSHPTSAQIISTTRAFTSSSGTEAVNVTAKLELYWWRSQVSTN